MHSADGTLRRLAQIGIPPVRLRSWDAIQSYTRRSSRLHALFQGHLTCPRLILIITPSSLQLPVGCV
jgi:hypothetical protein